MALNPKILNVTQYQYVSHLKGLENTNISEFARGMYGKSFPNKSDFSNSTKLFSLITFCKCLLDSICVTNSC